MEMLKHATGIDILAVPFRGDAQIHAALLGGEVEVAVVPAGTAIPLIHEGRIRAIGVTGAKRNAALPDVPTVMEQGVPGFACPAGRAGSSLAARPRPSSTASNRRWRRSSRSPTCRIGSRRWATM